VPFLHYDAAKASIDEAMATKRQHRVGARAGPSSMHFPYAKATAGLLHRRRHIQMSQMRL